MSSSWGPFGVPPQSFLKQCSIADVKRLREISKKTRDVQKVINNEERASKLEELKTQFNLLVNQYEGDK
tara:strand:+ start:1836 stop:2042 length:207 start_codon:yes stop_codon:yes gene_type:complete